MGPNTLCRVKILERMLQVVLLGLDRSNMKSEYLKSLHARVQKLEQVV